MDTTSPTMYRNEFEPAEKATNPNKDLVFSFDSHDDLPGLDPSDELSFDLSELISSSQHSNVGANQQLFPDLLPAASPDTFGQCEANVDERPQEQDPLKQHIPIDLKGSELDQLADQLVFSLMPQHENQHVPDNQTNLTEEAFIPASLTLTEDSQEEKYSTILVNLPSASSAAATEPYQVQDLLLLGAEQTNEQQVIEVSPIISSSVQSGTAESTTRRRGRKPTSLKATPPSKSRKRALPKDTEEYRERRDRNNVAVRKSRDKAKQRQQETEEKVKDLTSENDRLQKKCDLLTKELNVLKGLFTNVGAALPKEFKDYIQKMA